MAAIKMVFVYYL